MTRSPKPDAAMIAENWTVTHSRSSSSLSVVEVGMRAVAVVFNDMMTSPIGAGEFSGQASMLRASFPRLTVSRLLTLILRGFAFSAIGRRNLSTPAV